MEFACVLYIKDLFDLICGDDILLALNLSTVCVLFNKIIGSYDDILNDFYASYRLTLKDIPRVIESCESKGLKNAFQSLQKYITNLEKHYIFYYKGWVYIRHVSEENMSKFVERYGMSELERLVDFMRYLKATKNGIYREGIVDVNRVIAYYDAM